MGKRKIIIISAFLLSFVAGVTPVAIALFGSIHYAERKQLERLEVYANEVLRVTLQTADQVRRIFTEKSLSDCPPCSSDAVRKMLELQMSSDLVQSVAAIEGNYILCTSNNADQSQNLGRPDGITPSGTEIWLDVRLSFVPQKSFSIYKKNGVAAIVSTEQLIDLYTDQESISLALMIKDPGLVVRSRGDFNPAWLDHYVATGDPKFKTASHWVIVKSDGNLVSFAAINIKDAKSHLTDIAYVVLPLGVLLGIVLAGLVLYAARHRLSIKSDIKTALKRQEFFMHYQPVVNLETGAIVGAESLIRWRDAEGNLIPPDVFIPVAEQSGLIQNITQEVVKLVKEDVEALWQTYPDFHIGINLSSVDMQDIASVKLIRNLLEQAEPHGGNIIIEATERGFVDADQARSVINELHHLGVEIAIDDFGTGYSSLSHLQSLDLNYLKIDKTFIDSLGTEAATSSVALHIIEMAKSLNLKMVAEGVETQFQADLCREKGVQLAQGWYFGRPMPMDELVELLNNQ